MGMCGKCKKMSGVMMLVVGLLWLATSKGIIQFPIAGVNWLGVMLVVVGGIKTFMKCPECEACCGK